MERETLKEALQRCEELEREFKINTFNNVVKYVRIYKEKYGYDEWIEEFTQDYLRFHQNRKV